MALRGEGLAGEEAGQASSSTTSSTGITYVLHPNCAVEEY